MALELNASQKENKLYLFFFFNRILFYKKAHFLWAFCALYLKLSCLFYVVLNVL